MLQLKNLWKNLGDFQLKNINFTIEEKEYFIILGPTGTGKTVILEVIAGMYRPDKGEIWFNGKRISDLYPEQRDIGFVYQDYALFPHLTVEENIAFGLKVRKRNKEIISTSLYEIVSLLGIEHLLKRYPSTLSGGEQQRTALARALITSPGLLLLDEPLSALDPRTKQIFQEELRRIHRKLGTTTVHITHDFSEAIALGDRIGVMYNGEIVQVGTPAEVFRRPNSRFVAEFVGAENIIPGKAVEGAVRIIPDVEIQTVSPKIGDVILTIRPEDIIISRERVISSAQNSLPGRIVHLANQGPIYRITIDSGIMLTALVSPQSVEQMALNRGDNIWATFKSAAVHVL
ncbi:MAG: tungstate ABC transporter ATP-binding protein WtpC [Syntrophomonadaceae bacterium]|nr:tungstate ABC transporter ATP-binding protein WtpC [Syntrophomonadaceae bacterium]MDD3890204.1 tungstate ABC transporter ATP-binding protein WtpC [Syntrophomonadaceae bacterium]MDD4550527.1 tungstate ABC transporter ATP-binding protein WtpC [Syntrophomonadaceae bacterium]